MKNTPTHNLNLHTKWRVKKSALRSCFLGCRLSPPLLKLSTCEDDKHRNGGHNTMVAILLSHGHNTERIWPNGESTTSISVTRSTLEVDHPWIFLSSRMECQKWWCIARKFCVWRLHCPYVDQVLDRRAWHMPCQRTCNWSLDFITPGALLITTRLTLVSLTMNRAGLDHVLSDIPASWPKPIDYYPMTTLFEKCVNLCYQIKSKSQISTHTTLCLQHPSRILQTHPLGSGSHTL